MFAFFFCRIKIHLWTLHRDAYVDCVDAIRQINRLTADDLSRRLRLAGAAAALKRAPDNIPHPLVQLRQ